MSLLQRQKRRPLSVIFGKYAGAEDAPYLNGEPIRDLYPAVRLRNAYRSERGAGAGKESGKQELVVTGKGRISRRSNPERDQASRKEKKW